MNVIKPITITQGGVVIAEHSCDSPLSHYGQSVWVVQEPEPSPGRATWLSGAVEMQLDIICVRDGWLVCKQPDGLLCGIIWSDGDYHANILVDDSGEPAREWRETGLRVKGTVYLGEGLGAVLPIDESIPAIEPEAVEPEMVTLTKEQFESKMHEAQAFQKVQPERSDYWSGVQRGLRRAYHGDRFGTEQEHQLWLDAINNDDPQRKQRGEGYRDGLKGKCTVG